MPSPWPDFRRRASLRFKLTAWNSAVVLVMILASLVAARVVARQALYADADAELRSGVREIVLAIEDLYPNIPAIVAEVSRKARSQEQRGWFCQLLTEDGTTLWKSDHCPESVATFPPSRLHREENVVQVGAYRYVRLRVARPGQPAYHVRVGTYTTGLDDDLTTLMRYLALVGLALALLTPVAGWWLARRATQPVADILSIADRLRPTRLGDRLPDGGREDELDRLARTINSLLDQVAGHVERQQQFVADAAHELRGPLAAVSSLVSVAISQDRSAAEYRRSLEDVLEEMHRLSTLANALLTLAELTDSPAEMSVDAVDMSAVVRQTASMFAGVADDRGVGIAIEPGDVVVAGNAAQLRQVIGNLLDNAIRFTPAGGIVKIRLSGDASQGWASLTVSDSGEGIVAAHLDRIFDRFFKADPARSRRHARSGGLGLPICKAIVERHGGTIKVASRPGWGTTVTVALPMTARVAAGPRAAVAAPA